MRGGVWFCGECWDVIGGWASAALESSVLSGELDVGEEQRVKRLMQENGPCFEQRRLRRRLSLWYDDRAALPDRVLRWRTSKTK